MIGWTGPPHVNHSESSSVRALQTLIRMNEKFYFRSPNQEKLDEVKLQLCDRIDRFMVWQHLTQEQLAFQLGTSRANVNRIVNRKIKHLSISQLFKYLSQIKPNFEFLIHT